ncbi:MAG: hypothetical protein AABY33_02195 [Pseudomonadota bacterium]
MLDLTTNVTGFAKDVNEARGGLKETQIMHKIGSEGNPGKLKLTSEQIETIKSGVKDGVIGKKPGEVAMKVYECKDVVGCTDMPAPTFDKLNETLRQR